MAVLIIYLINCGTLLVRHSVRVHRGGYSQWRSYGPKLVSWDLIISHGGANSRGHPVNDGFCSQGAPTRVLFVLREVGEAPYFHIEKIYKYQISHTENKPLELENIYEYAFSAGYHADDVLNPNWKN